MKPAKIRDLRKKLGMTQAQMAAVMGIHQVTMARWESDSVSNYHPGNYSMALLRCYGRAVKKSPLVGKRAQRILVEHGQLAAQYSLMHAAYGDDEL